MESSHVFICTDTGQVRLTNEDFASYYIPPDAEIRRRLGSVFIMADGIGGQNAGEVASAEAVAALQQEYYFGRWSENPGKRLEQATARANFHVFDMSVAMTSAARMGCALTALVLCQGRYYISHVGDTQCLLLRDGHVRKLTTDHSTTVTPSRFSLGGLFTQRPAQQGSRSFLSRAIGIDMSVRPEIMDGTVYPGDLFVLVTDGITAYLSQLEVRDALVGAADLDAAVKGMVAECNRRGGGDNMTLMVVRQ